LLKGSECSSSDVRRWQSYVEPGDEMETGSPSKRISRNLELDQEKEEFLPLPENTLTRNLGLDLIVVVTKVTG
jgi:dynein light intermediate chain 1